MEPACGSGTIVKVLSNAGYDVTESDIRKGSDFLALTAGAENIVTNPPYKQAFEFVEHAKIVAKRKIAMLLPLEFLGGQRRFTLYQDRRFPLKVVYVFAERLTFGEGKMFPTAHAWFVWERGCRSQPRVDWIAPK